MKNRTAEFQAIVEAVRQRNGAPIRAVARAGNGAPGPVTSASGFTKMAAQVGRDIQATAAKLEKLTKRNGLPNYFFHIFGFAQCPPFFSPRMYDLCPPPPGIMFYTLENLPIHCSCGLLWAFLDYGWLIEHDIGLLYLVALLRLESFNGHPPPCNC